MYIGKRFPAHFIYLRKQASRPSPDRFSFFSLIIFDLRYRLLAAQPLVRTVPLYKFANSLQKLATHLTAQFQLIATVL